MKKILLSVMALVAATSVNAQVEVCAIDGATIAGSDLTALTAGTELGKTESVTCTIAFDDQFKGNDLKTMFKVGETDLDCNGKGIQGNTNGPGSAASEGVYPDAGCVYRFVSSKDGYIYVLHKGSSAKNYVVFEEKARIPYIYTMINGGIEGLPEVFGYDVNALEGATETVDGITNVKEGFAIAWPETLAGYTGEKANKGGNSVIKFQVFKDLAYDVLATGSKLTLGGFAFDTTGDATILSGDVVLLEAGNIPGAQTGIKTVKTGKAGNAIIYNLKGQKVGADYKGLVIKNGQKFMQK